MTEVKPQLSYINQNGAFFKSNFRLTKKYINLRLFHFALPISRLI
jgi:hypothetical protein